MLAESYGVRDNASVGKLINKSELPILTSEKLSQKHFDQNVVTTLSLFTHVQISILMIR